MAKVAPEIKARLLAEGKWGDFALFRDNAIKSGTPPAGALRLAIAKFCPELAALPPCSHRKGAKSAKDLVGRKTVLSAASAPVASPGVPRAPSSTGLSGVAVADTSVFAGRRCSMAKAMDWVIEALAVDPATVDPASAPSQKAWSIFVMCIRSPSFCEDVITKAVVRQIPNGMRDDDSGDDSFDGSREYDLLGAMGAAGGGEE